MSHNSRFPCYLSFEKFSKKPNVEVPLFNIIIKLCPKGSMELKKSLTELFLRAQWKSALQKYGKCQVPGKGVNVKLNLGLLHNREVF